MSDSTIPSPHHLPRWSKTAAIVMLLVFSLVVVVALFGLWAFNERRDADDERRSTKARDFAGHVLDDLHNEVRVSLSNELRRAAGARTAASLRAYLEESTPSLVRIACRYNGQAYYWIDDRFLLYAPPAQVTEWANAQYVALDEANRRIAPLRDRLEALPRTRDDDPIDLLDAYVDLVLDFNLLSEVVSGERLARPVALYRARSMLQAAQLVPADSEDARDVLRRAMLAALSTGGLNAPRTELNPTDRDRYFTENESAVLKLLARLPRDVAPYERWEVERFTIARDVFLDAERRRPIETAIGATKLPASQPRPGEVQLHYAGTEIVAIIADPDLAAKRKTPLLTALHLDWIALQAFVTKELNNPRWATPGFRYVLKSGTDTGDVVMAKSLADLQGQWNLPMTVAAESVPEPMFGTATDWFYWGIIGLACFGIAVGGWGLVRLLTRQVRLAELKADFVSNLSHELKTPITSIGLFAEMLQDGKLEQKDERDEAYAVIAQETERLKHTVARMLSIASRAASRSPYKKAPGDLNDPVRRAATRFERLTTDDGLTLDVDLSDVALPMVLDEAALEDVATNLLTNAWKYKRGDTAHIRLRTRRRRGKAVLSVVDDGVGIPRSERRRVFQMFYRSEPLLTQAVSGTGLGLALVRTVVRGHGGRIRVFDGPGGRGTSFEAVFPLASELPPRDGEVTDEQRAPRSDRQTRVSHDGSTVRRPTHAREHRRESGPAAEHS